MNIQQTCNIRTFTSVSYPESESKLGSNLLVLKLNNSLLFQDTFCEVQNSKSSKSTAAAASPRTPLEELTAALPQTRHLVGKEASCSIHKNPSHPTPFWPLINKSILGIFSFVIDLQLICGDWQWFAVICGDLQYWGRPEIRGSEPSEPLPFYNNPEV